MPHFREALRLEPNMEFARHGIVEAMKARNPIYRWILSFFLWMQRFSPRTQMLLVVGLVFGNRILHAVLQSVPMLQPLSLPIALAYLLFVWMSWSASALFNLTLFTNSFGRLALSRKEKTEAILCGSCVAMALLGVVLSRFLSGVLGSSLLFLLLVIPIVTALRAKDSRRRPAVVVAVAVSIAVFISFSLAVALPFRVEQMTQSLPPAEQKKLVELTQNDQTRADRRQALSELQPRYYQQLEQLFDQQMFWFNCGLYGAILSSWMGLYFSTRPVQV